jgi:hypothetical protein
MTQEQEEDQVKLFFGKALCGFGIVLSVLGAFFISVSINVLGLVLGMLGYALGTRRLGTLTMVLAVITLALGLFLGQGAMPGGYDRVTDGLVE